MKLNIVILSVACFFCLVPSAYGSLLVTKAIAAAGAAKGAALLGAGALAAKGAAVAVAKGAVAKLAVKGAAVLAAKHAALKSVGAAVLGAKALAIKAAAAKWAALLSAKGALSASVEVGDKLTKPTIVRYVPYKPVQIDVRRVPYYSFRRRFVAGVPRAFPTLLADRVSALVSTSTTSLAKKASAASTLLAALSGASAYKTPLVLEQFEVVEEPTFFSVPVVEKDC